VLDWDTLLESWQPRFLDWWTALGPSLPTRDVYLRTATAIGRDGWATWARVPMEQYRWGIFLSERGDEPRAIGFGQHKGEPAWTEVPGEYRSELRRLIVVQGDTEPASVEQQRHLGATAPSPYDLRNLFQVNVEEGRHLWAMVYLLHAYFGRDGREEAEQLLNRHSGHPDSPRILGAFNEATTDWLSFFMFTYFTDRDGKYQLGQRHSSLAGHRPQAYAPNRPVDRNLGHRVVVGHVLGGRNCNVATANDHRGNKGGS
jgi:benzoyl-CoA 2,3-epoxidase subunit B